MEWLIIVVLMLICAIMITFGEAWNDAASKFSMIVGILLGGFLIGYLFFTDVRTYVNESLRSTEGCTEWYLDQMFFMASDGEIKDFKELKRCMNEWRDELNNQELEEFYKAIANWSEEYPKKDQIAGDFAIKHNL